ncbi:hypothetical protein ACFFRR_005418 [Megaselia abdita]
MNRRGGGVALYISNKLKSTLFNKKNSNVIASSCLEFVSVKWIDCDLCISVLYVPPSSNFYSAEQDVSCIMNSFEDNILVGDFNNNLFDLNSSRLISDFSIRNNISVVHNVVFLSRT